MKTQREIYQKIKSLEADITEFKNIINNSTEWDVKSDYSSLIFEVENRIIKMGIGGVAMATKEQKIIFRKMEEILRNYPKYQKRIKIEIENLQNPRLKKSCGPGGQGGSNYNYKSEIEQIEELKQRISNNISRYEEIIFRIDECLSMVQDHKDYGFIQMKYFDKMTYEEIAEKLKVSVMSTYRMRNNILSVLEIHFKTQRLIEF